MRQNAFTFSLPYDHFDEFLNDLYNNKARGGVFVDSESIIKKAKEVFEFMQSEEYKKKLIKIEPERLVIENDVNSKIKDINKKINNDLTEDINNDRVKLRKIIGNRKKMKVYKFELVRQLIAGDTFGELALENKSHKRTATIIAYDKCDFAVIKKEEYNILIKDSVKKYKRKFFSLIYSYKIFRNLNCKLFDRDHYNNFRFCRYPKNKLLLQDNVKSNEIFFILDGEFELYIEKNIFEINDIINKLKLFINKNPIILYIKSKNQKIQDLFKSLKNLEKTINQDHINQDTYKEILSKKKTIKLGIYTSRQVIGLENYISYIFDKNNNKSLVNCKCISYFGEFYRILFSKYNLLYQNEKNVRLYSNELVVLNVCHLMKRLLLHKSFELDKIKQEKKMFEKIINTTKLLQRYNKNTVSLEKKNIKTNSFIRIATPIKQNGNDTLNIKYKKNISSDKYDKKKYLKNKTYFKLKSKEIQNKINKKEKLNFSSYSKINIQQKEKKSRCLNSAMIIRKKNNNNSLNNSHLSHNYNNSINKKSKERPLSKYKTRKTIKIPNIYQIFFPLYNEITINSDKDSKLNQQILNVEKLHEDNKNFESITNSPKKINNTHKIDKILFKKLINSFKKSSMMIENISQKNINNNYKNSSNQTNNNNNNLPNNKNIIFSVEDKRKKKINIH